MRTTQDHPTRTDDFWRCTEFGLDGLPDRPPPEERTPEAEAADELEFAPESESDPELPDASEDDDQPKAKGSKHTRKRNGQKRRKRKRDDPNGLGLGEIHFDNSVAWVAEDFDGTAAPHAKDGYIGRRDGGRDYNFLKGSYESQVDELKGRKYAFLDPPKRSAPPRTPRIRQIGR